MLDISGFKKCLFFNFFEFMLHMLAERLNLSFFSLAVAV